MTKTISKQHIFRTLSLHSGLMQKLKTKQVCAYCWFYNYQSSYLKIKFMHNHTSQTNEV